MAGIYVHIPFCKSRCIYCDFYSTTREAERDAYVAALCNEIAARSNELSDSRVHSIYIGGGTPSQLSAEQLRCIYESILAHFDVDSDAEITVEMNPDDVVRQPLPLFVNRVSLGIQTFNDQLLSLLRRRHDSATAMEAVHKLQAAGINNISIDLIYGLPNQTMDIWQHDMDAAFSLGVQHLSAYALSYEEGTVLSRMKSEGKISEADEELSRAMYYALCSRAGAEGFCHYEISNFALPGKESRHNSSYWAGVPYLGFGPGAHGYDGQRTRRANLPDLKSYINYWSSQTLPPEDCVCQTETLTDRELYDEAVMCGLRTSHGIDLQSISQRFGQHRLDYLMQMAGPHLRANRLVIAGSYMRLTKESLMTSDDIMSDLMAQ